MHNNKWNKNFIILIEKVANIKLIQMLKFFKILKRKLNKIQLFGQVHMKHRKQFLTKKYLAK